MTDNQDKGLNRRQVQQLIESAIRTTAKHDTEVLEQIEAVIRKVLREEFKDIGLRVDSEDQQAELREDFRHLRMWRQAMNGFASKVGWAVILSILGGLIWIFTQGLNFWNTRPPTG